MKNKDKKDTKNKIMVLLRYPRESNLLPQVNLVSINNKLNCCFKYIVNKMAWSNSNNL